MTAERKQELWERAYDLLLNGNGGRKARVWAGGDQPLTNAVLRLMALTGLKPLPPEESRLTGGPEDLAYLERAENIRVLRVRLEGGWPREDLGSFIAFRGETPVIMRRRRGRYEAMDPATGKTAPVGRAGAADYEEEALFIYPACMDREKLSVFTVILEALKRRKRELLLCLLLSMLVSVIGMLVSASVGVVTRSLSYPQEYTNIGVIGLSMLMAVLAGLLINIVVNRCKAGLAGHIRAWFCAVFITRIMNASSSALRKVSGSLSAMLLPIVNAVETFITSAAGIVLNLLQAIMILVVIHTCGSAYAGIAGALAVWIVFVIVMQLMAYRAVIRLDRKTVAYTAIRGEFLDNIETIKNNGIEDRMFYRFAVACDGYIAAKQRVERLSQAVTTAGALISGFGVMLIFADTAAGRGAQVSSLASVVSMFTLVLNYVRMIVTMASSLVTSLPQLRYASTILSLPMEAGRNEGSRVPVTGDIEFSHVTFAYSRDEPPVLRDLSFHIRAGEYVGIAGSSGSGKSTVIRLLLGLEKPDSGLVTYDGVDVREMDIRFLRRRLGVVLQDAAIMNGSVRANIGLSDDADMDRVRNAARLAAIDEEIEAMPMKYDTILSGEAETISGGQRQRIVLARALYHEPRLLLLDEATSAMDNAAQARVRENLDRLGMTRVTVAHRLSTIRDCDRILVLEKGELAEEGSFDELLARDGLFARMARRNM